MNSSAKLLTVLAAISAIALVSIQHADALSVSQKRAQERHQRRVQSPRAASSSSRAAVSQPAPRVVAPQSTKKQSSSSSIDMQAFCAQPEWTCSDWSPCNKNNSQRRTCTRNAFVTSFCGKKNPTPSTYQFCFNAVDPKAVMADNLEKWDEVHKEMVDVAKGMTQQGFAGKAGLQRLNTIESSFVLRYNEYLDVYNDPLLRGPTTQIEKAMEQIIKEFRALPVVWY